MSKLTILTVVLRPSDFTEMKRFSESFQKNFKIKVIMMVHIDSYDSECFFRRHLPEQTDSFEYIIEKDYESVVYGDSKLYRTINKLRKWARIFIGRYKRYCRVLKHNKVDLLVLPEDIVGCHTPLVIKAGHANNIPSVIIPYTISNRQETFQSIKTRKEHHVTSIADKVIAYIFPKWTMKKEGVYLLRAPKWLIISLEVLRLAPPDPWMMNSGFATCIYAESQKMFDYYVSSGIERERLFALGAVYDDEIYSSKERRKETICKLKKHLGGIDESKIIVICGCPNQFIAMPPAPIYSSYKDLLEHLSQVLSNSLPDYTIIFKPHPNYLQAENIAKEHSNFKIVEGIELIDLLSTASLYLSFCSATIRWAILQQVKTINYDVFGYDYDDYIDAPGVLTINTKHNFISLFKNQDITGFKTINKDYKYWGCIDGGAAKRIYSHMGALVRKDKSV